VKTQFCCGEFLRDAVNTAYLQITASYESFTHTNTQNTHIHIVDFKECHCYTEGTYTSSNKVRLT